MEATAKATAAEVQGTTPQHTEVEVEATKVVMEIAVGAIKVVMVIGLD